jgi:restriction system protein
MINKPFNLNVEVNNLVKVLLLILTSILAILIGFSLVIYTLPSLSLLIPILSIIAIRYNKSQKAELIKRAHPYIDNFIDSYFKLNSMEINETHPFPKSINSLQYLLEKEEIKLKEDILLSLVFEKLLLRFIESNLDYSFQSNLVELPEFKLKSLHYILDKLKIKTSRQELYKQVKSAYHKRKEKNFNKFFLEQNPTLANQPTIKQWSKAYIDTFENNTKYIHFLEKLILNKGINLEKKELESQIEGEIEKRIIEGNAKNIYQAMASQKRSLAPLKIDNIDEMSGEEFERVLKLLFEKRDYNVKHIGASDDQGADLILKRFNIKTVVQAKKSKNTIGNAAIQEVVAAKSFYSCQKMMVITNSTFALSAKKLAKANNVELWDREKLTEALKYTSINLDELKIKENPCKYYIH